MSGKIKGGNVCSARNCKNTTYKCKESFFGFPKDLARARIWVTACGRDDLMDKVVGNPRSYRLCGAHFESCMFLNELRNRLRGNAVPTIFPSMEGSSNMPDDHNYCVRLGKDVSQQGLQ